MRFRSALLRGLILLCGFAASAVAMAWPWTDIRNLRGITVELELAPGAADKKALDLWSDSGYSLAGKATLNPGGGGVSGLGGVRIPKYVRATWRKGDTKLGNRGFEGGTIVGDYTIPVLDRIPDEVFEAIRAKPKRGLVLRFRIKDDGVLLGWAVRDSSIRPGCEFLYGGDFVDEIFAGSSSGPEYNDREFGHLVIENRLVHSESRGPVWITIHRPTFSCEERDRRRAAREAGATRRP